MSALVELRNLVSHFQTESSLAAFVRRRPPQGVTALDDVSLTVQRGECIGIVGESGCGKSTLARTLVGLVAPTSGTVNIDGAPVGRRRSKAMRRRVQMVFQDPSASLNPARTVGQTLAELLRVHNMVPADRIRARCLELLDRVQLPHALLSAHPQQMSGGQRQRMGIARALALEPDLLVADEAVAALDASVQASILNLLIDLKHELGFTIVFISHDITVVRHVSDRTLVMYLGRIVEAGPTAAVCTKPRHPYTRALMAAAPQLHSRKAPGEAALPGEPRSQGDRAGCRFFPRCPIRQARCQSTDPKLAPDAEHTAACLVTETMPKIRGQSSCKSQLRDSMQRLA